MDIIEYIEKSLGYELKEYQKGLVKALHQGVFVTYPRHHGRKLILEKIKEYNEKFTN